MADEVHCHMNSKKREVMVAMDVLQHRPDELVGTRAETP